MQYDKEGFLNNVTQSFAKERYKKRDIRRKQWNVVLTVIFILLSFTIYLQGCTIHVHPKKSQYHCERINDYEVVCKNG